MFLVKHFAAFGGAKILTASHIGRLETGRNTRKNRSDCAEERGPASVARGGGATDQMKARPESFSPGRGALEIRRVRFQAYRLGIVRKAESRHFQKAERKY
jgi:hypothetical protein